MKYKCSKCDGRGHVWLFDNVAPKRKLACIYCNGTGFFKTAGEAYDVLQVTHANILSEVVNEYVTMHEKYEASTPIPSCIPLPEGYCQTHRTKMELTKASENDYIWTCLECGNKQS